MSAMRVRLGSKRSGCIARISVSRAHPARGNQRHDDAASLEIFDMVRVIRLALFAALLPTFAWIAPAGAQSSRSPAGVGIVQAERNSVELKQGMSLAEVQTLLGKPRRTALKDMGGSASTPSQGNLRWTYVWSNASLSDKILNVEFVAKTPADWYVNGWEWTTY